MKTQAREKGDLAVGSPSYPEWKRKKVVEVGYTDCGCNAVFKPGIVLDPFIGSAHDKRYNMDTAKILKTGLVAGQNFEESLATTVWWYRENEGWWPPTVESEDYRYSVKRFYGKYLGEDL
ncbi:MAG: hypothetical protein M1330_01950 [Armatimonadetes bacterium]|nr:hypothetical protein [Armatimonadota bacterium]